MDTPNKRNVYVFDMDNTLIRTDEANNLAYSEAISLVLGIKYNINQGGRFTRDKLKTAFPYLSETQLNKIIAQKEKCFGSHLRETELNQNLSILLEHLHHERCHTILLTYCHKRRAIGLCKHYNLTSYFDRHFYREDCLDNKYTFLQSMGYDLQDIILYENDEDASSEAIANGVNSKKIIKVEF